MLYDFLIVGSGLSSATICAILKHKYKICVIENRAHLGGNCYDYKVDNTYVHKYGPHIFHTFNKSIFQFLSKYTKWNDFKLKISAEIEYNNNLIKVPFPYSMETEDDLKCILKSEEILDLFFKGYSKKMWGIDFNLLPDSIKKRVSKNTDIISEYFIGEIQAMPKNGYTYMLQNMFDGVDILLNQDEYAWNAIPAKHIIYTGRIDRLLKDNHKKLQFRSLRIDHNVETWDSDSHVINFCHMKKEYTRKTNYGLLHGDNKLNIVSTEYPYAAHDNEVSPYYPIPTVKNLELYKDIKKEIEIKLPHIDLCGRLGCYKYLDMDQIVGQAIKLANKYL